MSTIVVNSTAELVQALTNATGGEVIQLAAGTYGSVFLKDLSYSSDVTLTSLDPNNPAVFTETVTFVRADGLVLDNLVFQSSGLENGSEPLLFLNGCENVTMTDLVFTGYIPTTAEGVDAYASTTTRGDVIAGYGYQTGLRIHNSDNISLTDAEFRDLRYAIYLGESTDVLLTEMSIEAVREGIMFYEVTGLTVSDSVFQNFKPWLGMDDASYDTTVHDHPDMIQYWGDNSVTGVHDITITGNTFIAEEGSSTQTIFGHLDTAPAGVTATNFTITDNTIVNGHTHAISLGDVDGAVITGNTLLPNSEEPTATRTPTIRLPGSTNVLVQNNTVVDSWGTFNDSASNLATANIILSENTILSSTPTDDNYWGNWVPASAYPLVQWAETNDINTVQGTSGDETLRASSGGSYLYGLEGNDTLAGRNSTDIMIGGSGADRFHYDMRSSSAQSDDLILDLDFSEGDEILILTSVSGLFTDTTDPDNTLRVMGSGQNVIVDSVEDLWELVASGLMTYASDGLGGGILAMADGSGYALHLAGVQSEALTYAALLGTTGAVTGSDTSDVVQHQSEVLLADEGEPLDTVVSGKFLNGLGGDDVLIGQSGADIMTGGSGADLFYYDLRGTTAQSDDLITDLDFSEGDAIYVLTDSTGLFSDAIDPDNVLEVSADGSSVRIDSMEDLWELLAAGTMALTTDALGNGVLSLADGSGYSLTLVGITSADLPYIDAITALASSIGTSANDVLWASNNGGFLNGLGGDDVLCGRAGADILMGGDGADRFQFDLRQSSTNDDLILDLNFDEGDEIYVLTSVSGLFTDTSDPDNALRVLGGGKNVIIDSLEDLAEIVASGAMALVSDGADGAILKLADGSGYGLHLLGIDVIDLVYGDRIAATAAVTGTNAQDTLWASSKGSYLQGLGGDDVLCGRAGADIFEGGDGADRFQFDLRQSSTNDDLILDLNFDEGDEIYVITNTAGLFTNSADPNNTLTIPGNGSTVIIQSITDLQEVVASGVMVYESDGMGGGYLSLADESGFRLQIAALDAYEIA